MNHKANATQGEKVALTSGRRKFLTRAGTGLVIGALPAQSVWATTLMGSVIASGAASTMGNTSPIKLQSHGRYKNQMAEHPEVQKKFKDVFGRHNRPFSSSGFIKLDKRGGGEYWPSLWQILSSTGSGITLPNSVKTTDSTHVKDNNFNLSGPNNVNIQMVTLYLNAYFYSMGGDPSSNVYYPVIGNERGQFSTPGQFATRLYELAKPNPSSFGNEFGKLINKNHV